MMHPGEGLGLPKESHSQAFPKWKRKRVPVADTTLESLTYRERRRGTDIVSISQAKGQRMLRILF